MRSLQQRLGPPTWFHHLYLAGFIVCAASLPVTPGWSQSKPLSGLDTDKPIEISADSLEVKQDENIAIFTGNVDALQGDIRLRASQLTVHYRSGEGGEAGVNAISRIDASGSVFITSGRETAQGETGVYDVENSLITLIQNVVLTRGENVIRGNRLVLDLVTGQTRVDGGESGPRSGGRVRSLFVPKRSTN